MPEDAGKIRTVVHVITQFDGGGSAVDTYRTALGHDRRRYRAWLVYGRSELSAGAEAMQVADALATLRQAGVSLLQMPTLVRALRPIMDARATLTLWRFFRRRHPDIVHTHTSKAGAVGRLAAWLARVPVVIHTPHGHIFYGYYGAFGSWLLRLAERLLSVMTDRIVTLTARGAQEHVEHHIAGPHKFTTIPSGVDLASLRSVRVDPAVKRKDLGLPAEALVIGTVGRLVPVKGQAWLIRCLPHVIAEFPGVRCVLIGDGPLEAELRRLSEELHVGRHVVFLGMRNDVPECLAAFDLFAFPSLNEGMGMALVEAMAMGLPVVATRVGGIPDIVTDGVTGLLVPPKNEQALGTAVMSLLRDPGRRRAYGEAARRRVDERFDAGTTVREIERLYEAIWREKR